ncbi:stress protein [Metabacillus idriensis]|nr:stress protein [Metabacillus idriensis]MCM3598660.1 stress protein [Metabacillus idriensis]
MKKLTGSLLVLFLVVLLAACGNSEKTSSKKEEVTVDSLIAAFKEADLEAEEPTDLESKEFGNTRKEGKRILVPALGDDAGGRLFEFDKSSDLDKAKSYYDELSNSGPLFFSHTYKKGNFLLQMNGEMEDKQFDKYKEIMDEKIK